MKRTCNYCKALSGTQCSLGFKNEPRTIGETDQTGWFRGMKPSEECPKPMTHAQWLDADKARVANGLTEK